MNVSLIILIQFLLIKRNKITYAFLQFLLDLSDVLLFNWRQHIILNYLLQKNTISNLNISPIFSYSFFIFFFLLKSYHWSHRLAQVDPEAFQVLFVYPYPRYSMRSSLVSPSYQVQPLLIRIAVSSTVFSWFLCP